MIFLKLGGSLITDKSQALTPRLDIITRLAGEIQEAFRVKPDLQLILGHGSGSFGHHLAARYDTQNGASSPDDWLGFCLVADAARQLHQLVMEAMLGRDLPVMSFSPSSMLITQDGTPISILVEPIQRALKSGLIPVVYGDAVLDIKRGSAIISTEGVFKALGAHLKPEQLLLAGIEPGVFTPGGAIIEVIRPAEIDQLEFVRPEGEDVTGGMRSKVEDASQFAIQNPESEVLIFSPSNPGDLTRILLGASSGTRITS